MSEIVALSLSFGSILAAAAVLVYLKREKRRMRKSVLRFDRIKHRVA